MTRLVEAKRTVATRGAADFAGGGGGGEGAGLQEMLKEYGERVAKYVPAEVLAFYTAAVQLILTKEGDSYATFRLWAFAIVGLIAWIGTPLWLGQFTNDPKVKHYNQVMAFIAFGVWTYAYPAGWFKELGLNDPVVGGLLLLFFSFVSGFVQPKA